MERRVKILSLLVLALLYQQACFSLPYASSFPKKSVQANSANCGVTESPCAARSGVRSSSQGLAATVALAGIALATRQTSRLLREPPSGMWRVLQKASSSIDASRAGIAAKRLFAAEAGLSRWSLIAEVVYAWLGTISLGIAGFAAFSRGFSGGLRNPSTTLGLGSVVASALCAFFGWYEARNCRSIGRRCGVAARLLEPGVSAVQSEQVPSVREVERSLNLRQRVAWLGALFAVVGLQTMVGLLVSKVLITSGGIAPASGVSLDVFTLLAVGNAALCHIIGGGFACLQQSSLPAVSSAAEDDFGGWACQ